MQLTSDPIVLSVIDKFNTRSQIGINKYGTTLQDNNTDDFLKHLQEELMDAVNYIEKLRQVDTDIKQVLHNQVAVAYCVAHKIPYTSTEVDVTDLLAEDRRRFFEFDNMLKLIFK